MARAGRLGHRVPGAARVYGHVTPQMGRRVLGVPEDRWRGSVTALTDRERERLFTAAPPLGAHYRGNSESGLRGEPASKTISRIAPSLGRAVFTRMSDKPSDLR